MFVLFAAALAADSPQANRDQLRAIGEELVTLGRSGGVEAVVARIRELEHPDPNGYYAAKIGKHASFARRYASNTQTVNRPVEAQKFVVPSGSSYRVAAQHLTREMAPWMGMEDDTKLLTRMRSDDGLYMLGIMVEREGGRGHIAKGMSWWVPHAGGMRFLRWLPPPE